MEKVILNVEDMSCEHCVKAVTGALTALPGTANVVVDLAVKTAALEYDPAQTTLAQIKFAVEEQGYSVS